MIYSLFHLSFPLRIGKESAGLSGLIRDDADVLPPATVNILIQPPAGIGGGIPAGNTAGGGPDSRTGAPPATAFIPEATSPLPQKGARDDSFVLPLARPGTGARPDFRRYPQPGIPGLGPWLSRPSGGGAPAGNGAEALGITGDFITPDLLIWAQQVVRTVNQNWFAPGESFLAGRSEVTVAVTVRKNGDILESTLKSTGAASSLAQAALNAVKLSRHFPPLPRQFPEPTMAAVLVFQYGD